MGVPYAEVIGDPIAHSKSPLIHRFWLEKLGLRADYQPKHVGAGSLQRYLGERQNDIFWRGCNVTAPLKQKAAALVRDAFAVGTGIDAVNCIVRTPLGCLVSTNTDLAGLSEALGNIKLAGRSVAVIGSGGAARAALSYLETNKAEIVHLIARNKRESGIISTEYITLVDQLVPLSRSGEIFETVSLVINASAMGMMSDPDPDVIAGLAALPSDATVFDMVYAPVETGLLREARARGNHTIDGLTMLVGQAAPAFELFFGTPAPRQHDAELRELLTR